MGPIENLPYRIYFICIIMQYVYAWNVGVIRLEMPAAFFCSQV